jgi:cysteine desulfurase
MKEILRVSTADYANPSSVHTAGVLAKKVMEQSRLIVANFLHAHADEIFFTASGTEANNIAIRGTIEAVLAAKAKSAQKQKSHDDVSVHDDIHILVSAIEHASVLETVNALSATHPNKKIKVDFIPIHSDGIIDLSALKAMLRPETVLVSVMLANNDIGTIQPVREAVKIVRDFKKTVGKTAENALGKMESQILFHTDACQAPLYLDINMETLGVDFLTLDSNKVCGPRGVGVLYKKRSVEIDKDILPIMTGGGQENDLRPGTENVPAIAGLAKALEIALKEHGSAIAHLFFLQNYFIGELKRRIPGIILNGSYAEGKRLVNNVNVTFPTFPKKNNTVVNPAATSVSHATAFDHEFFLLELDARGIACSTKSACLRDADESYVVRALRNASKNASKAEKSGMEYSAQSIRFSLGRFTTKKDIDYTLKMIDEIMRIDI